MTTTATTNSKEDCDHPRLPDEPDYMGWHEWAKKNSGEYYQVKCKKCRKYIWEKREF